MNIKKEVVNELLNMVSSKLSSVHNELHNNRYTINKLAARQKVLKKEISELYKLQNEISKK